MTKSLIAFSLLVLFSASSPGAESDHFTIAKENVPEVADQVNQMAQDFLQKAVVETNSSGSCVDVEAKTLLYTNLQKYFANHSTGLLPITILTQEDFPKVVIPLKDSVYGQWKPWNGYLLGRKKAATSPLALSPLIKIGDQVIGVDKLEHMFGMGFRYYQKYYGKERSLVRVLMGGIWSERTILGGSYLATGVFSYADLAANFNGMRFWNHILQEHEDVLGASSNYGPYITCHEGQWQVNQQKPLDFRNYIDASMDESVNCSKFATYNGAYKFKKAAATKSTTEVACPQNSEKLAAMLKKYEVPVKKNTPLHHYLINTEGNQVWSWLEFFIL